MKRFFQSEIGAAVCWVLASLLLAAVISPWIYQAGKNLAGTAEVSDLPAWLEGLGAACGRAKFGRFFNRSLMLSALLLLPILFRRIKGLRTSAGMQVDASRVRVSAKSVPVQLLVGFMIAGGLLALLGWIVQISGAYVLRPELPGAGKLVSKVVIPGIAAPLLEEWLFRGVLLGLWLRFSKPLTACVGSSLLFAFLHFLKPPAGYVIADPTHAFAGFELVGKILLHFSNPVFFITDFATLFVVGMILAWARVRTGALWFSIGLHSGWVVAFKGFNQLYKQVQGHALQPWGIGDSLRAGILPMLTLGLTALLCHFVLMKFAPDKRSI